GARVVRRTADLGVLGLGPSDGRARSRKGAAAPSCPCVCPSSSLLLLFGGRVTVRLVIPGLPPAQNAPPSGASPADEGAPTEEPASFAAADAAWVLLGAALPAFRRPEERRPAPAARRRWF